MLSALVFGLGYVTALYKLSLLLLLLLLNPEQKCLDVNGDLMNWWCFSIASVWGVRNVTRALTQATRKDTITPKTTHSAPPFRDSRLRSRPHRIRLQSLSLLIITCLPLNVRRINATYLAQIANQSRQTWEFCNQPRINDRLAVVPERRLSKRTLQRGSEISRPTATLIASERKWDQQAYCYTDCVREEVRSAGLLLHWLRQRGSEISRPTATLTAF